MLVRILYNNTASTSRWYLEVGRCAQHVAVGRVAPLLDPQPLDLDREDLVLREHRALATRLRPQTPCSARGAARACRGPSWRYLLYSMVTNTKFKKKKKNKGGGSSPEQSPSKEKPPEKSSNEI